VGVTHRGFISYLGDDLMNSHRDNVKKAVIEVIRKTHDSGDVVDAVFDALGITEDEQHATGGYFMHHAGKRSTEYMLIPLTDEIRNALSWEEAGHYIWKFFEEARKT
jgi:hypothetical protein